MMDLEVTKVVPKLPDATLRDFPGMELLPVFQTRRGGVAALAGRDARSGARLRVAVWAVDELTTKGLERAGCALKTLVE